MHPKPAIAKSSAIAWAGGSSAELARRMGVTPSAVSQWPEDGIPDGRLWQLVVLGCPVDEGRPEGLPE
jgi:hypothetical protein